ncbi:MAG: hypothetical protein ACD_2C00208G0006 [uncultured bacterium (gcode 4)]|uniref:Uncharacterized protein n=1 Tax=uncultured bacterium (gcode 4) TaxID=1234023 RepID=K2H0B4_9BACT|nr:MAG: hypothetical protein ACD_2C00208G0006 [uncultured bacterium (gcode 4)]
MAGNRFYIGDKEAEHISDLTPECNALLIQNSLVWEEWELIRESVYEIIAHTGFRANFAETADFLSSISQKEKPDLFKEVWIVNVQLIWGGLTRDDHLPKVVKMLSNQKIAGKWE